jgi:2-phosphosulfolactate phosphatase
MPRRIVVHLVPQPSTPGELSGRAVAVIDVLRATTVIVHALAAGARQVIACREVDEARSVAAGLEPATTVTGGERGSVRIEGFDLSNSPREYTAETVAGRTVVFTTTNGTKAMAACHEARRVLIASFANCSAVADALDEEDEVHLLCAGLRGGVSQADTLCAGAIADKLCGGDPSVEMNDEARLARAAWQNAKPGEVAAVIAAGQGGRNLIELGFAADIDVAARLDTYSIVPRYDPRDGSIRVD